MNLGLLFLVHVTLVGLFVVECADDCYYDEDCSCEEEGAITFTLKCTQADASNNAVPGFSTFRQKVALFHERRNRFKITIRNKVYKIINELTFASMILSYLDLSRNDMKSISPKAFDDITRLDALDLSENGLNTAALANLLDSLGRSKGNELGHLSFIDLDRNRIDRLNKAFPPSLKNLDELRLRGNMIETILPSVFRNLKSLMRLFLSENSIKNLDSGRIFDGLSINLRTLDVSYTQLENPASWTNLTVLSNLTSLTLTTSNLQETVNLSKLEYLNLENNKISEIKNNSFSLKMISLNLNRNQLTVIGRFYFARLAQLKELYLTGNRIESIENQSFSDLVALQSLLLTQNNLKFIEHGVLNRLRSLVLLDLSENSFEKIDTKAFDWLKNLRKLSFGMNLLTSVSEDSFMNLTLIEEIDLSSQKIESIDLRAFGGVPNLIRLNLFGNLIDNIQSNTFDHGMVDLDYLNLASNQLDQIGKNAFKGLSRLRVLDLSNNYLEAIENKRSFLLDLHALTEFSASFNLITSVQTQCFVNNRKLTSLSLDSNRLVNVAQGAFKGLEDSLKFLMLNSNKLQLIKRFYFAGLVKLLHLHLRNNQISSIDKGSFRGI